MYNIARLLVADVASVSRSNPCSSEAAFPHTLSRADLEAEVSAALNAAASEFFPDTAADVIGGFCASRGFGLSIKRNYFQSLISLT